MRASGGGIAVARDWLTLVPVGVLVLAAYHGVLAGMVAQWLDDPNYSHGLIVPLVSGWFAWQRRDDLRRAVYAPANSGLALILFALVLLLGGTAAAELFSTRVSFILLIVGAVAWLFGWGIVKILALPLGYLFFMVPWPYLVYDAVAFPLKLFVARFSVAILQLAGVIVWREGNIIQFPNTLFEVADACSGLRSMVSLLALAVALAFLYLRRPVPRTVLILMAIPVAVLTNMVRVIGTGFLAQYMGAGAAEGFFHEFAGLGVFALALVLLFGFGALLRRLER